MTVGAVRIGSFGENVESLNITAGATFTFGDSTNVTAGYVAPVGSDQQLDGGFRLMVDYHPTN